MTMGLGTVQKASILTSRTLSFSLVFFTSVTVQCSLEAARSTTLTRNRPRHLNLYKCLLMYPHLVWHHNQKDEYDGWQPLVAVLEASRYIQRRGTVVGRKCQNSVLFNLQKLFEVVLTSMH